MEAVSGQVACSNGRVRSSRRKALRRTKAFGAPETTTTVGEMLARLIVLLPQHFTVPEGAVFSAHGLELAGGYAVVFKPFGRSDRPLPPDNPEVKIDGQLCYMGDVFVADFLKAEFNRNEDADLDPPVEMVQQVIKWFFHRLRYVINAPQLRTVNFPHDTAWRIEYLADDGTPLPQSKGLVQGRGVLAYRFEHMAITPPIWDDLFNLPLDFEPPQWEVLLLDARNAVPEIGPAVVLTATALEVFVNTILDNLAARGNVSPALWDWINNRGFFLKEPSPEEQFDVLLKELGGVSLKQNNDLWRAFKAIKEARNKFVHEGVAKVGENVVTSDEVVGFLRKAREIIDFVTQTLPDDLKRSRPQHQMKLTISQPILRAKEPAKG
jgi:hypothetical protein